ncbi:tellurite resistance TerB family protein [Kordiimonas aquimaris]|uniref:tellurite resistance TerB family protein n=1 Tax=Kordiimonas aquimaris TaxID=707591 RepID=UPI0021CE123B|nr:TerB family tellurite resistance protein [Kordiimonas aquimaris]
MFDKVSALLGLKEPESVDPQYNLQLSTAALLVYVSCADGEFSAEERSQLIVCLTDQFELDTETAEHILSEAELQQGGATCLYQFTRAITDQLDQDGRQDIVRLLWRVALADNHIDNFEANMLAKVAGLLGVSTRDRVLLKHEVEAAAGI